MAMHITMVTKIKHDGSPCRKCAEIKDRLEHQGLLHRIDRIVIADERDPESEGMQLAAEYNVTQAPFFVIKEESGITYIYTVYFRFLKEILQRKVAVEEELAEIIEQHPDLDYI
ncbi:MAG: hypothetical protein L0Z68_04030 [Gammaproteobacteria bacterium]|nr:hypothetical protein [Gammaproteobacteria bacterium]